MRQNTILTLTLCVIWAVTLLYGEFLTFWRPSLWSCSWPHHHSLPPNITNPRDYVKVAVLTDPQLTDRTSLRLPPKSLALEAVQFYSDLYMRRAFLSSVLPFKPDVILFLGDYFDGGPYLTDNEWLESLQRFKHIFRLNAKGRHANIPFYYIPGNHDIGYSGVISWRPEVTRRYEKEFGVRNYRFVVGEVEFIAIDAQTLDGNPRGKFTSTTWDFIKNVSTDSPLLPKVLLSHIPLYRPDNTQCGRDRKSRIINQYVQFGSNGELVYQNFISDKSSKQLLDLIKAKLILSGHDHDQCTVIHESKFGSVIEHTVGTFSWQQGNLYPSFMLMSVTNSSSANARTEELLMTQLCFLPMQTHIYISYAFLFVLTLLAALLWPTSGIGSGKWLSDHLQYVRLWIERVRKGTKEKNEDENCEYEMMWDAEGTMHLVRKQLQTPAPAQAHDGASIEKGNVVLRATTKKVTSQEKEVSMDIDAADNVPSPTLRHRATKSKTKIVIQRLVRTFQTIALVAAINVPLYVMLLFRDWID